MRKSKVPHFDIKSVLQPDKERSIVMQISIIVVFFIIIILGGMAFIWFVLKNKQGSKRAEGKQVSSRLSPTKNVPMGLESSCSKKENMEIIETIEALADIYKNDI